MRKISIFIVLLALFTTCVDHHNFTGPCKQCFNMRISKALPIPIWLENELTFNEKEVCSQYQECWCQPWNNDLPMVLQIGDADPSSVYTAKFLDANDSVLFTDNYEADSETILNDDFAAFVSTGWDQDDLGEPFSDVSWTQTTGRITANIEHNGVTGYHNSLVVYKEEALVEGEWYRVGISWALANSVNASVNYVLHFYTIADGIIVEDHTVKIKTGAVSSYAEDLLYTFQAGADADTIGFSVEIQTAPGNGNTVYLEEMSIDHLGTTYNLEVIPSAHGLSDKQVKLEIYQDATRIGRSDCIDIRESHECTYVVGYSNANDYAGLVYPDTSPQKIFYILLAADFNEPQFPEEDEEHDLSDSEILTLSSEVKAQRFLDTDHWPAHFHRLVIMVLKHQMLYIDDLYWVKNEKYTLVKKSNKRYPLQRAQCWLTEKNFLERNV